MPTDTNGPGEAKPPRMSIAQLNGSQGWSCVRLDEQRELVVVDVDVAIGVRSVSRLRPRSVGTLSTCASRAEPERESRARAPVDDLLTLPSSRLVRRIYRHRNQPVLEQPSPHCIGLGKLAR